MTSMFGWSVLSFAVSAGITGFLLKTGLAGWIAVDRPNPRSLHLSPTPRCGGLGVVLAIISVSFAVSSDVAVPLLLTGLLSAFSLLDDRIGLPIWLRLLVHLSAASLLMHAYGSDDWLQLILLVLVIAWSVNLFNFMDGANGLAGGAAVIGFAGLALSACLAGDQQLATMGTVAAAGSLGFLIFNYGNAKIFLGDLGSIPLGFLAAALSIYGWQQGTFDGLFILFIFSPFIFDATVTLLRRMIAGKAFWQAHRDHYYQRLIRMGWTHRRVAVTYHLLMIFFGAVGFAVSVQPWGSKWFFLMLLLAAYAAFFSMIDSKWKTYAQNE